MVVSSRKEISRNLRRGQIALTIAVLLSFVHIALSPAYILQLESGQSIRIPAAQGPSGALLLFSALLMLVTLILSFRRFYGVATIMYSALGSTYVFFGLVVPAGEETLNAEVENASGFINWLLDRSDVEFNLSEIYIRFGPAWNLLVVVGFCFIVLALILLLGSHKAELMRSAEALN